MVIRWVLCDIFFNILKGVDMFSLLDYGKKMKSKSVILESICKDDRWAIVSLFSNGISKEENKNRHIKLKNKIKKKFGCIELKSEWINGSENAEEKLHLFIKDCGKESIINLCEEFNEFYILYRSQEKILLICKDKNDSISYKEIGGIDIGIQDFLYKTLPLLDNTKSKQKPKITLRKIKYAIRAGAIFAGKYPEFRWVDIDA